MTKEISPFKNSKRSKIIFLLSLLVSIIWVLGKTINIYQLAIIGAIFELMWLPVLALTPILLIGSIIFWIKDKLNFKSLNLYSFLVILITILFTIFIK
jgi:hypothetical protein